MKTPKNVIWITTDHMRSDNINANGNPHMHTPNIDFLAKNGVSFTNCFAQSTVCMPSRASFMTGLYPQQTGVSRNGVELPADFKPTVATAFNNGNFLTAQIGKLHFQNHEDKDLDPRAKNNYGFDIFHLSEEPGSYEDAYMNYLRTEYPEYVETFRVPRSTSPERVLESQGAVLDAPWGASFSGFVSTIGERFLENRKGDTTKKFMHLGFYAPHPPLNPTKEMMAPYLNKDLPIGSMSENEAEDKPKAIKHLFRIFKNDSKADQENYIKHFYAMVTGVDFGVGKIIEKLKEIGQLDDTLIVLGSDHGDSCTDHGLRSKHPSFYDEVLNVPCVMFWPNGFNNKNYLEEGLMENLDILPTILELSNVTVPDVMMGRSYAKSLMNVQDSLNMRDNVFAFTHPGIAMVRNTKYKYIYYPEDRDVLYDYKDQPAEVINHAENPVYKEILSEMKDLCLQRLAHACQTPLKKTGLF